MSSDFAKKLRSSGAEMAGRDPEQYMTFLTVAQGDATADHIDALEAEVARLTRRDEVNAKLRADQDDLIARLTAERNRLWTQREGFDCHYAGPYAETSGMHCPFDKPCLRCQNERLTADLAAARSATYIQELDNVARRLRLDLAAARAERDGHVETLAQLMWHRVRHYNLAGPEQWDDVRNQDVWRDSARAALAALPTAPKEDDDAR